LQSNDIWVSQNFHIGCQEWYLANSGSGHDHLVAGIAVEADQLCRFNDDRDSQIEEPNARISDRGIELILNGN
jgi:hypothetical protein